jgi:UDP-N-acetylglucosamine acyltransferase
MSRHNMVFTGAALGHHAQNKATRASYGVLEIGNDNIFREYVTVHRGSEEKSMTHIGDHNYFMAFSHVGHDCQIQSHITVANAVLLAGHVAVEDHCMLGGACGIHQFCRIGRYAMIGGHATITKDVPPYMLVDDNETLIGSLNVVGLRRAGFSEKDKRHIKNAYKLLYLSGLNTSQALAAITRSCCSGAVPHLVDFIRASKRGILKHRRMSVSR